MKMNRILSNFLDTRSQVGGYVRYLASKQEKVKAEKPAAKSSGSARIQTDDALFVSAHAGSGYCRTAVVNSKGKILKAATAPIKAYVHGIFIEISSEDLWRLVVKLIRHVVDSVDSKNIKGVGFTAFSALVCLDANGNPIAAGINGDPSKNMIPPYDNRSMLEAERINKTRHELLQYLGEKILADIQETKLMWLKSNLKEDCWDKAGHFFDLSDFLTWKATGSLIRSSSTLVSQWTYEMTVNGKEGWNADFFNEIGIPEVTNDNFHKIGSKIQRPGLPLANGLLEDVAKAMGLSPNLPVPTAMPDGLAGCLGVIGCQVKNVDHNVTNRLCINFGTKSTPHFVLSRDPHFVKSMKGPFQDIVLPQMWLNTAAQTTAENVLDFMIDGHPGTPQIQKRIGQMHIHKYLNKILKIKAHQNNVKSRSYLTKHMHILPDFEGNKSPYGDPWIRGMVSGLSLIQNQESLAILYLATIQSLAYSTKHILSTLTVYGHDIRYILLAGYLGKNSLLATLYKDVCQLPTVIPREPKAKLIGAAILAGIASEVFRDFSHAIGDMGSPGQIVHPTTDLEVIDYHEKKYRVFLKMYDHQREYRRIMSGKSDEEKSVKNKD